MKVTVVGTGYVGLVVGTCLSDFGMEVVCVDNDTSKIDMLQGGVTPIYEIGLTEVIKRNVKLNRLSFTTDLRDALTDSEAIFIGVGTPEKENGEADLSALYSIADEIANSLTTYTVIIIKSTVPVGTAKKLKSYIKSKLKNDCDFDIVSNPEFLREGTAVDDFLNPDRIVLGTDSEKALSIMKEIYRPFSLLDIPIVITTNETAELIKYVSNTMLALKVSFINEVANLCDATEADVYQVAQAIGMDKRIGPKFLQPGPGYGGSCLPKDVHALAEFSKEYGYTFKLADAIIQVNEMQRQMVVAKTKKLLGDFKGKKIALLGLAFKPNTDDVREAPSLYVAEIFRRQGALVSAYDPIAMEQAKIVQPELLYCTDVYTTCKDADIVIIMTEWNEFRDLDFSKLKSVMKSPNLYDTKNIYTAKKITNAGFNYLCTGRPVK